MRELLSKPAKEYPQFTAGLSLAGVLSPAEVADLLEERTRRLQQEIDERRAMMEHHMRRGLARMFLIEEEHRMVLAEAELETKGSAPRRRSRSATWSHPRAAAP